jgi:hypothetical protein
MRLKAPQEAMVAYLATLAAIVVMSIGGAVAVALAPEERIDEVLSALVFISAGVTGLVGVIGTFRPKGRDESGASSIDEGNEP